MTSHQRTAALTSLAASASFGADPACIDYGEGVTGREGPQTLQAEAVP